MAAEKYIPAVTVLRYIAGSELAAGMTGDRKTERFCQTMYKRVEKIPAADVRPVVRGKWEIDYLDTDYPYECSNCHGVSKDRWSYCPFCGADMRGEANP